MLANYLARAAFVAVITWWFASWAGAAINSVYEGMAAKVGSVNERIVDHGRR